MSLSGPDGRVLGGSVAGLLTAASPVQVRSILFFYSFVKEICMTPNVCFWFIPAIWFCKLRPIVK